jgi:protease-4
MSSSEPSNYDLTTNTGFVSRIWKKFWRWIKNFFAIIGFVYTIVPILIALFFYYSFSSPKSASDQSRSTNEPSYFWLNLDTQISSSEQGSSDELFSEIFGGPLGISMSDIRTALREAETDPQVTGVYVKINGLSGSLTQVDELAAIFEEFREKSKKPIEAYISDLDNTALLLAAACDKVNLSPVAGVFVPGPVFGSMYFGEALRKVGVDVEVVRAGKYKSAFEPFITNDPSPEAKEMMLTMEASIRSHLISRIAAGRKKQPTEVALWLRESIFTPSKAKEMGLVDELKYPPAISDDEALDLDLISYTQKKNSKPFSGVKGYSLTPQSEKGIALIEAIGEIMPSSSGQSSDELITPDSLVPQLTWARENENVTAVVLRIDSPGGSASASDEIWEQVRQLAGKKVVVASLSSVAASGGYYIAAAAQKIVASASTITGSIGVIGLVPNFGPFKDKYGITFPVTTQSQRAAMLSGGQKLTPEDHKYLGQTIDETYQTFKARVSEGRKMPIEKVEALAQGRVYSGLQAKELGLIDQIGGLKTALQLAKKESGLDENQLYPLLRYEPAHLSLEECVSSLHNLRRCLRQHGTAIKSSVSESMMTSELRELKKLKQEVSSLQRAGAGQVRYIGPKEIL